MNKILFALTTTMLLLFVANSAAAGEIALSFDDAPKGDGAFYSGLERTRTLIAKLDSLEVDEVVFFCTTNKLENDSGRARPFDFAQREVSSPVGQDPCDPDRQACSLSGSKKPDLQDLHGGRSEHTPPSKPKTHHPIFYLSGRLFVRYLSTSGPCETGRIAVGRLGSCGTKRKTRRTNTCLSTPRYRH